MPNYVDDFAKWVRRVLDEHNVKSSRQAEVRSKVSFATIQNMLNGRVPEATIVIRFAAAYGEDVGAALRLAGYDDIAGVWETGAAPRPPKETREPDPEAEDEELKELRLLTGRLQGVDRKLAVDFLKRLTADTRGKDPKDQDFR